MLNISRRQSTPAVVYPKCSDCATQLVWLPISQENEDIFLSALPKSLKLEPTTLVECLNCSSFFVVEEKGTGAEIVGKVSSNAPPKRNHLRNPHVQRAIEQMAARSRMGVTGRYCDKLKVQLYSNGTSTSPAYSDLLLLCRGFMESFENQIMEKWPTSEKRHPIIPGPDYPSSFYAIYEKYLAALDEGSDEIPATLNVIIALSNL